MSLNPKLTSGGNPGTFPRGRRTNEFIHHACAEKQVLFTHILAPGTVPGSTPQGVETQRQREEQGEEERRGEILFLL